MQYRLYKVPNFIVFTREEGKRWLQIHMCAVTIQAGLIKPSFAITAVYCLDFRGLSTHVRTSMSTVKFIIGDNYFLIKVCC